MTNFEKLFDYFEQHCQVYFPAIRNTRVNNKSSFDQLAKIMLSWAEKHIGKGWEKVLADGYVHFLMDVNRSQVEYERRGHYLFKKYDDVFDRVYNNPEFMSFYHWGVFVSTFAWEHHIKIYNFYKESFLTCLKPEGGRLLDLGSGSGIWSFLTTHFSPRWTSQGIDISEKSVELSTKMATNSGLANKVQFHSYDALKYLGNKKYNAAISCFLLEHLEDPKLLLQNMALNLENKAHAVITGALTASEVDHIYEFRRESEIVLMAEKAGFRVVSMYSAAPSSHPDSYRFLPRSLALILQKRKNDIW